MGFQEICYCIPYNILILALYFIVNIKHLYACKCCVTQSSLSIPFDDSTQSCCHHFVGDMFQTFSLFADVIKLYFIN